MPHHQSPAASSSSDTGESSGSDSDSSSDDTGDENPPAVPNRVSPPVVPVEATHTHLNVEESKPRWNLASYIGNGVNKESPTARSPTEAVSPLGTITSSILPLNPKKIDGRKMTEESDESVSTKDVDRLVAEVLATKPYPLLSSLSDSDASDTKRKTTPRRRKRAVPSVTNNHLSDSEDSDSDRDISARNSSHKVPKPKNRVSPIAKPVDSNLSESEPENKQQFVNSASDLNNPRLTAPPAVATVKPKSNRGRPRKDPEARGKKRGRPPLNKRNSVSGSDNEQPVRRRGRPPLKPKPPPSPSSSEDEQEPAFGKAPVAAPAQRPAVYSSSSESEDSVSFRNRKNSLRSESDRESIKFGATKKMNKHKTSRSDEKPKRSDDEWAKKIKSKVRDNQTNDIKQKPPDIKKKEGGSGRGRGRSGSNFKSLEYIPSDIDSDSDSDDDNNSKARKKLPAKRTSSASSGSDSGAPKQQSSDSENNMEWKMEDKLGASPFKLDGEKSEQDKKKGATLRKLFVTTRASDGGKGGGKGGKGGKGKGGVNVIVMDESNNYNYEHSSSSVEDDPMLKFPPNPTLLSPIPKREDSKPPPLVSKETSKPPKTADKPSVIVKIDLNRLSYLPKAVKKRSEEMRQAAQMPNTRQTVKTTSEKCDSECEIVENRTATNIVVIESDSECSKKWKTDKEPDSVDEIAPKIKPSKRKRRHSGSSLSSISTVSSIRSLNDRRKESKKEKDNHKTKRRKEEEENGQRSQTNNSSSFTNVPPTNHEREGPRTPALPSPDCSSAGWTQSAKAPVYYYSYFERLEPSDDEDK